MYKRDEDIDRLSREAAEHYNAPGQPSWDALRQTLDKELPQEKEKKRRGFLLFFLLALGISLAGTAWYATQINHRVAGAQPQAKMTSMPAAHAPAGTHASSVPSEKINTPATVPGSAVVAPAHASMDKTPATALKQNLSAPVKNTAPNAVSPAAASSGGSTKIDTQKSGINSIVSRRTILHPAARKKIVSLVGRPATNYSLPTNTSGAETVTGEQGTGGRVLAGRSPKNKKATGTKSSVPVDTDVNGNASDAIDSNAAAAPVAAPRVSAVAEAEKKPVIAADTATAARAVADAVPDSATKPAAKTKNTSGKQKAILLGLVAGADMSTVKFTYGSNTGYNFGLSAGYQFNRRWALLTGIIYTKKNYKLDGSDYHPPTHYWTQYVNLTTVDGYCRMWELPIVARYVFNPAAMNAFFVSGGLSSYFMKKQQYDYYYKNNMGSLMVAPWSNDSTFNHIFTILDLSVGVQKPIGKYLDLLIEPYAKIPLAGVGFGNIRLSSFGVNLTVQYKQLLKR